MKPEPLRWHPGRSLGGSIYPQMLPASEKPGQGQKILEDVGTCSLGVHYARPGNILNWASRLT